MGFGQQPCPVGQCFALLCSVSLSSDSSPLAVWVERPLFVWVKRCSRGGTIELSYKQDISVK